MRVRTFAVMAGGLLAWLSTSWRIPAAGSPASPSASGLVLELRAGRSVVHAHDDILVTVRITNDRSDYRLILPSLSPPGQQPADCPKSELELDFKGLPGSTVRYQGRFEGLRYPPPPSALLPLGEHEFWGKTISLRRGEFAYDFRPPGTYQIIARFRSSLSPWLARQLKLHPAVSKTMEIYSGRVFDGALTSNPITVKIE